MKLYLSICFVWFYFCLVLNKTAAAASRRDPFQKHVCSTARLSTRPHALRPCPRHQGVAISNLRSLIFFEVCLFIIGASQSSLHLSSPRKCRRRSEEASWTVCVYYWTVCESANSCALTCQPRTQRAHSTLNSGVTS